MKQNLTVARLMRPWGIMLLLAVGVGCSPSTPSGSVSPEQQVAQRAEARWNALAEGNLRKAYDFESPGYRAATTYERYVSQFGNAVSWQGAKVTHVTIAKNGDAATVTLAVRYSTTLPDGRRMPIERGMTEKWILAKGQWWLVE